MTVDPVFDWNGDLPAYSNEHQATMITSCPDGYDGERVSTLVLPSNRRVFFGPGERGNELVSVKMPQSRLIEHMPLEGPPVVEIDNSAAIDLVIEARNSALRARHPDWEWGPTVAAPRPLEDERVTDRGCAQAPGEASGGAWLLALALGLAVGSRLRRQ
jgi:MYXO-CTERM domain-containing protein